MDVMSKLPGPRRVRWLQVRDREQDAKQKAKGMCAECRSHPAIRDFRNAKLQKMISPFCKKAKWRKTVNQYRLYLLFCSRVWSNDRT